jgi:hypothetical protein
MHRTDLPIALFWHVRDDPFACSQSARNKATRFGVGQIGPGFKSEPFERQTKDHDLRLQRNVP